MSLSPAEKQRRYRERQKQIRHRELKMPERTEEDVFRKPFFEHAKESGNFQDFEFYMDLAGIEPPAFTDDSGAKSFSGEAEMTALGFDSSPFDGADNSLGRAEMMVGCLIDAAATLAEVINDFKKRQIGERIAELEGGDLAETDTRKAAVAKIVQLNSKLDQLSKQVRWSFPQWKLRGE